PRVSIADARRHRSATRELRASPHTLRAPSIHVDEPSFRALRLAPWKAAAKLFTYFFAVVLGGALLAPPLFWSAHRFSAFFAKYDFESFFHRALLICALAFLWPLLRSLRLHSLRDLQLDKNRHALRDIVAGILLAAIPLLVGAVVLIAIRIFLLKNAVPWNSLGAVLAAAFVVPLIEELFFRGLLFGILLRGLRSIVAILITSAFFAIVHFLKAPARPNESV